MLGSTVLLLTALGALALVLSGLADFLPAPTLGARLLLTAIALALITSALGTGCEPVVVTEVSQSWK